MIFDKVINNILERNIWTPTLGLGRSILAFGTLLTLVFNEVSVLFKSLGKEELIIEKSAIAKVSLFEIMPLGPAKWLAVVLLIVVILGYLPRIMGVVHWWISFSFINSATVIDGGDQITSIITLLLIPVSLVDFRKNHWNKPITLTNEFNDNLKQLIGFFSMISIKLQVAFIYFDAAIGKFSVNEWADGTAIYYWFTNPVFGINKLFASVLNPLLANKYFIVLSTYSVLLLEVLLFMAAVMSWQRRKYLLFVAILFHLSIVFIHGLASFFFAMAGCLVLYLVKWDNYKFIYSFKDLVLRNERFGFLINLLDNHGSINSKSTNQ
ncbi:sporulation-delaying protein SdpB family protein [Marinoscillum pacificum]|uniref:sporulation-delaying protein SdpB family protein n=1 Tax=Marinoscillum pacificum TaxID=392723 RepID=UPI00215791FB|nr:sporulation-delaying protein SdpB family protein [Marinoscillum pacificum]